jgi:hypothetical protein
MILGINAERRGDKKKAGQHVGKPQTYPGFSWFCLYSPEVLPLGGKCVPLGLWMGTACNADLSERSVVPFICGVKYEFFDIDLVYVWTLGKIPLENHSKVCSTL